MIQTGRGSGFAPETIQSRGVAREFVGQELESDKAFKPGVLGLVDHAHSSAAQLSGNAVMRDGATDREIALAGERPRGHFYRRRLQEAFRLLMRRQQIADLALQRFVVRA